MSTVYGIVNDATNVTFHDLLTNIYRGDTETITGDTFIQGMSGLQIRVKRIRITGNLQMASTPVTYTNLGANVRMLMVLDNQASNNTALVPWASGSAYDNLVFKNGYVLSQINDVGTTRHRKRFRVLLDKHVKMSNLGDNLSVRININKKVNIPVEYYPTTTTFSAVNTKILFLILSTDNSGNTAATNVYASWESTVYYTDS